MKEIIFVPGVTFQVPNIIKKIKDISKYTVFSSSPKYKFEINQNGKYFFIPLFFKIISRIFRFQNNFYQKYIDVKLFQFLVSKKKISKHSIIFAGSCYAEKVFKKNHSNIKILDVANVHVDYGIELLETEYRKFDMKYNFDKKMRKIQIKEYELADKIMVPSNYSMTSFKKYGFEKKVFKSFFSSTKFSDKTEVKKNKKHKEIILGFIGGNIIIKGLYYLMKSLNESQNNNLKLKLCLPLNYLNNFNHISREYNKSKMQFLGFTNKIDDFYKKIDVLVVPSVSDGFAQVVLEALSRNIPVVCSDAVGSSEFINEEFGYVFPRCSIDKLIEILDK